MNAEERNLISGLFDRMRSFGSPEKDRDAEALISQNVRAMPDAPYMLVQSVLVQEQTLQQAGQRIEELEGRVAQLESQGGRGQASSGGFLGGLFGGGRATPSIPPRPMAQQPQPQMSNASPWGRPAAQQQPVQAGGGGGGFMKTAMATAAGVAGGMILADSIRGMMGSGSHSHGTQSASAPEAANSNAGEANYQDPNDNDPGNYDAGQDAGSQDASYDSGGGFDSGGGDMDI